MDDSISSCNHLTSLLKDSGLSHPEIGGLMSRLHADGIMTELGYEQALKCLESNFALKTPSTFASEQALDSLVPNAFDMLGISSTDLRSSPKVPTHISAEAKKYRHLHNQAFSLDSRTDRKSLARRCLNHFTHACISSRASNSVSGNIFLGVVNVARAPTSDQPQDACTQAATLLIDTGSDFNIISLCLAKRLSPEFAFEGEPVNLANTGGGYMYTWGRMAIRWWRKGGAFGKKFVESTFYVSAKELDVDVIIGWQEIVRLDLVSLNPRLCFVGYNSKPLPVNKLTVAIEEAAADARRRAEQAEMDSDASSQHLTRQRAAYAHERARQHVQIYASQYRALHGEAGLREACQAKYNEVYRDFFNA